jgi:RP/EB family microtubule-associated protein
MIQLRDIEILVQQQFEALEAIGKDDETLREIQKILYSTEVCCKVLLVECHN